MTDEGLIHQLERMRIPRVEEATGWENVDRTVGEIRRRLAEAQTAEQFQAVGLLCREALTSLGQAVYHHLGTSRS
jgi:hypothetical protein